MDERVSVIEDGVSEAPQKERSQAPWLIAIVAFVVGLGLGAIATSPGSGAPVDQAQPPTPSGLNAPVTTVPEALPEDQGISAVVEGFPDALVAVARTAGSTVDYLLWPVAGELSIRPMSGGSNIELDVSSRFVALSAGLPDEGHAVLSMGRYNSLRPVAPEVSSYAFHDTANGWLAYTVPVGPDTQLWTVKASFEPTQIATVDEPATVVGWGEWGFVLQRPTGGIVLLNAEGEFKDIETGLAYATHPAGWVLVAEGFELKLVSGGGGVQRIGQVEGIGAIQNAAFSPDGSKLALDGERAVAVLDIDSGEVTRLADFSTGPVSWSSDSRFVLAASRSGVLLFDLVEEETHSLLREYTLLAVGVVPLTNP